MIHNITLTHWRAYRELHLSLTRPVTFFVAPNGVGKTSLVEAVRFALLGAPDARDRGRAVRGGHDSATVRLTLSLPGDSTSKAAGNTEVEVTRTLKRSGTATFRASVDGVDINEVQYLAILRRAWSADPSLLDALIFGPASTGKSTGFPIRDHIADVFGIQPLLDAANRLTARRAHLAARIKSLRDDLSGTDDAIAAAAAAVSELEAHVAAAAAERRTVDAAVDDLQGGATLAASWQRYRQQAQMYSDQVAGLVSDMAGLLNLADQDPRAAVEVGERQAAADLESSLAAVSAAQVRAATAASGADLLNGSSDHCPTCLRPLTPEERRTVLVAHGSSATAAQTEIQEHQHQIIRARQRVDAVAQFRRALAAVMVPVEPESPDPGPQSIAALAEARHHAAVVAERQGALHAQLDAARHKLRDLRQAAQDQSALIAAAREDLVAEVAEHTLMAVADRYVQDRIEPLVNEIGRRWKLLFGSEGLRLGADGQLSFHQGDVDLALRDLSGGERSTALLVTRLLLAGSVARTSTIWFDEPLEHLDPRRRAAVARTIVLAAQAGATGQILVTTYEESLVRRLAAGAPDTVEVTYARAEPPR